jgi:hypothetical protein
MKFSIGDKVVEKKTIQPHTSYNVLKIVGTLNGALLLEHYASGYDGEVHPNTWTDEPGSRSWRSALERFQEEELFTVEEAVEQLQCLESLKTQLDREFDGVRSQIGDQFDQAAIHIKEANALVKHFGKDFYDLKQEGMKLYKALDEGGWVHSHFSC